MKSLQNGYTVGLDISLEELERKLEGRTQLEEEQYDSSLRFTIVLSRVDGLICLKKTLS